MSMEPGVQQPTPANTCPETSPGGWHCCLPRGHDLNHIGTTADYEQLFQWPAVQR